MGEELAHDYWYRVQFKLKIYETHTEAFQEFAWKVYELKHSGFQRISPWGKWGDRGNDGYLPSTGLYCQVYGPKPTTTLSPVDAAKKASEDFGKLHQTWSNVKSYHFVLNDRFSGVPAPVEKTLQDLMSAHTLTEARGIGAATLMSWFKDLAAGDKQDIIGGFPGPVPQHVDPRAVGEIVQYLGNKSLIPSGFLDGDAPEFDKKIKINGLGGYVGHRLKSNSYMVHEVDAFLSTQIELGQAIAEEVRRLYEQSKIQIPDAEADAPSLRYLWMVDNLLPPLTAPHQSKFKEAAEVILAKYFETCDVYEYP